MIAPELLTDAQVRQFICDGFLVIKPDVDPAIHKIIDDKFCWLHANEPNPGNNILVRLPELNAILESPEVRGAMSSLLGPDYITCTHCYWHDRPPSAESLPADEIRKQIERGSHQDGYCPSAIGKSHNLQYIRFMYYSHDMTVIHGPTHVAPGTQYNSAVFDEDRRREMPVTGEAGTVFISHFELIHSGCPNMSDRVRNMVKFLFTRKSLQNKPNWDNQNPQWVEPESYLSPYRFSSCWEKQWYFLSGKQPIAQNPEEKAFQGPAADLSVEEQVAFVEGIKGNPAALDYLLGLLNKAEQPVRISAIYALADIGEPAIRGLVDYLSKVSKPENRTLNICNSTIAFDDAAQALIAIGTDVMTELLPLLDSEDEWVTLNALHILNILAQPDDTICRKLEGLLDDDSDFVVAWTLNALGAMGNEKNISMILEIFDTKYDVEHHAERVAANSPSQWPHEWIIHFNAALALNRLSHYAGKYEDAIASRLGHPFAQTDMMLLDCLRAIGSRSALEKIVAYSRPRIWDHSLHARRSF